MNTWALYKKKLKQLAIWKLKRLGHHICFPLRQISLKRHQQEHYVLHVGQISFIFLLKWLIRLVLNFKAIFVFLIFLIQLIRVSFMRGPTGRCTKGHVWGNIVCEWMSFILFAHFFLLLFFQYLLDLCSITLSVVADKHVRSCSNCNRKMLASSDPYRQMDEQSIASSVIVKAIFETCEKCFYCGGNFIFRQT